MFGELFQVGGLGHFALETAVEHLDGGNEGDGSRGDGLGCSGVGHGV